MANHYTCLGLQRTATQEEIKAAYRRLALIHHPDKPGGDAEKFRLLQQAYETLSDPAKRRAYDFPLPNDVEPHIRRLAEEGFTAFIPENPQQYDHYTYLNILLKLEGSQRFTVGQDITNYTDVWEKLDYVDYRMGEKESHWTWKYIKPSPEIKALLRKINQNSQKIGAVLPTFGCSRAKLLYDVSLGLDDTEERQAIKRQIGDISLLVAYLKKDYRIELTSAIFALREVELLTPQNFQQLMQASNAASAPDDVMRWAASMSLILKDLLSADLLTQANFNQVMQYNNNVPNISFGVGSIQQAKGLNQPRFEAILRAGKHARVLGENLRALKNLGILNDENLQIVVQKIPGLYIWAPLLAIRLAGIIPKEDAALLHWQSPPAVQVLNHELNQLFAHGVFLLSCDVEKGKVAMLLALALKKELKLFCEKTPEEQAATKTQFTASFIKTLHSKDDAMTIHRARWKIIIANILIALTGIGLIALGANYLLHGRCFFAQTARERQLDTIEHSDWLAFPSM